MSADVFATFDSSREVSVAFVDGSHVSPVRIIAARTDEHGRIIALVTRHQDGDEVVVNWDNVTRVRDW